jgi:uncharacterized delta-60 repeat protein
MLSLLPPRRGTLAGLLLLALMLAVPGVALAQDGSLDPDFGDGGRVIFDLPGTANAGFGIAVQDDGRAVIAGVVNGVFSAVRMMPDGTRDITFGVNGLRQIGPGAAFDLEILSDGRIVLAGQGETRFGVARLLSNGSLDGDFATGGTRTVEFAGGESRAYALAIQPDNRLILAGTIYAEAGYEVGVARLTANGTLDTTFGTGGRFRYAFQGLHADVRAVALQSDGRLVLAGQVQSSLEGNTGQFLLMRLTSDGNLDATFGNDGVVLLNVSPGLDAFVTVAVDEENRIVAAGTSDGYFAIGRFLPNGAPDPGFGSAGILQLGSAQLYQEVRDLILIGDTGLLLAGFAERPGGGHDYAAIRLRSDGTPDASFGQGGFTFVDLTGGHDIAFAAAIQPDESMLITGWAEMGQEHVEMAVVRLRAAGRVETEPIAPVPASIVTTFPNPTSGRATVELQLGAAGTVLVTVVDLLGRHVATLNDGHLSYGVHQLAWDASLIPPGTYLVRIVIEGKHQTQRLTVVH